MGNIEGQDGGKEQKIKWIISLNQSQSASRQSSREKTLFLVIGLPFLILLKNVFPCSHAEQKTNTWKTRINTNHGFLHNAALVN